MVKIVIIAVVVISLILETTIFSFPLILASLIILSSFLKGIRMILIILFVGLTIDLLRGSFIGITPASVFLVQGILYQDFLFISLKNIRFMPIIAGIVSLIYGTIVSYNTNIILYGIFFGGIFLLVNFFYKENTSIVEI